MKKNTRYLLLFCAYGCCFSCEISPATQAPVTDTLFKNAVAIENDPAADTSLHTNVAQFKKLSSDSVIPIHTGSTRPDELVRFAETLIGIPYVWASSDPAVGFDCSGFITYVFTHFNISVPRSSIDFFNVGTTVPLADAKRGDLILFTGTNPMETDIGHMGLVVSNNASGLSFIHSTSGKAMGVTITPLNEQYRKRFVRISRIF